MNLFPPFDETIEGVGRALRAGETTCLRVLERCLERIEEWEPTVRAWVVVDRVGAIAQARMLDEVRAAGTYRSPLHGIPIGIKDIIDVQGVLTACGARLWADRVAVADAAVVASLRAAGAVILGKTVTTPYAWIDPPATRNPWNLERTPGGSSSGSAAAVAAGMCLGAIGTQTGGSITRPASFCGVLGMKPSHGAINMRGIFPFSPSLDVPGPIARSVRDLELIFNEIIGSIPDETPDADAAARPPCLGRLRGFFDDRAEPAMRQAFDRAVATLAEAGARFEECPFPRGFEDVHRRHRVVMASEAAAWHQRRFAACPDDYPPKMTALIEEGLATLAPDYLHCRQHQDMLRGTVFENVAGGAIDAYIVPAAPGPAPDPSTTGDPAFNSPWSYAGLPTISIPCALAPDGMPLALQLAGRLFEEAELFRVATWCEAVLRRAFLARKD